MMLQMWMRVKQSQLQAQLLQAHWRPLPQSQREATLRAAHAALAAVFVAVWLVFAQP